MQEMSSNPNKEVGWGLPVCVRTAKHGSIKNGVTGIIGAIRNNATKTVATTSTTFVLLFICSLASVTLKNSTSHYKRPVTKMRHMRG
jgi:hypothetical protein